MRRREFITALGGAAAWPLAARAQQPAMPVIGFLRSTPAIGFSFIVDAFRQGLNGAGFVEGKNVAIEYRWADNQLDRLPGLAADLVRRQVAVIVGAGGPAAQAGKSTATTTPVIFVIGYDPVRSGLVASLNRPGGNITGVSHFGVALASKRLQVLVELVPAATVIGLLENPNNPRTELETAELQATARAIRKRILVVKAGNENDFETAFTTLMQAGAGGLLVAGEPLFILRRQQLVTLAARHAIPAIYDYRNFTTAGGLLSYGIDLTEMYRLVGGHVARILKGANPADLPILQPTKFELVINLKTAKALGLDVPLTLQQLADEVIE